MNRLLKMATVSVVLLSLASPALAAEPAASEAAPAAASTASGFSIYLGVAFGCGLIVVGAAYGISKIGATAVESMARQPEVAGNIQMAMIIAAALIEGVTFFALIVCLIRLFASE